MWLTSCDMSRRDCREPLITTFDFSMTFQWKICSSVFLFFIFELLLMMNSQKIFPDNNLCSRREWYLCEQCKNYQGFAFPAAFSPCCSPIELFFFTFTFTLFTAFINNHSFVHFRKAFSYCTVMIYVARTIRHLFHWGWTVFCFCKKEETAALAQIELKELNVFNRLFGECIE